MESDEIEVKIQIIDTDQHISSTESSEGPKGTRHSKSVNKKRRRLTLQEWYYRTSPKKRMQTYLCILGPILMLVVGGIALHHYLSQNHLFEDEELMNRQCLYPKEAKIATAESRSYVTKCSLSFSAFDFQAPWEFKVSSIKYSLCSHLVINYAEIIPHSFILQDLTTRHEAIIKEIIHHKPSQTQLLFGVGGPSLSENRETKDIFRTIFRNEVSMTRWISSLFEFSDKYGFEGFELDWRWPGEVEDDSQILLNFAQKLSQAREDQNRTSLKFNLTVPSQASLMDSGYLAEELSQHVNHFHILAYDLNSAASSPEKSLPHTGLHSDLTEQNLTVASAIDTWRCKVPGEKLVLSLASHGQTWGIQSQNGDLSENAEVRGPGKVTTYSGLSGQIAYFEVVTSADFHWGYNTKAESAWANSGRSFVYLDDPKSLAKKVEYVKSEGLAGVLFSNIQYDMWNAEFGAVYPLLSVCYQHLKS